MIGLVNNKDIMQNLNNSGIWYLHIKRQYRPTLRAYSLFVKNSEVRFIPYLEDSSWHWHHALLLAGLMKSASEAVIQLLEIGKVGRTACCLYRPRNTRRSDAFYPVTPTPNREFLDPPLAVGCKSLVTLATVKLTYSNHVAHKCQKEMEISSNSVRPSVCKSHSDILCKWLNIWCHSFITTRYSSIILVLWVSNVIAKFRRGHPLLGG